MQRLRRWAAAGALLLTMVTGCGGAGKAEPAAIVIAVDRSGSVQGYKGRYLQDVAQVLGRVEEGDRLMVLPIQANSVVAPVALDVTVPGVNLFSLDPNGGNAHTHGQEVKKIRASATSMVQELLEQPPEGRAGTAIVGALVQAGDLLARAPAGRRDLVILSDMIEQSQDVADFTGFREEDIAPLLARLREEKRLPSLQGTRVWVSGITDGPGGILDTARVMAIRSFWTQLVQAAGGELRWYGPTLVGFRE